MVVLAKASTIIFIIVSVQKTKTTTTTKQTNMRHPVRNFLKIKDDNYFDLLF